MVTPVRGRIIVSRVNATALLSPSVLVAHAASQTGVPAVRILPFQNVSALPMPHAVKACGLKAVSASSIVRNAVHVPFPVFAGMRPAIPMNHVIPVRPTAAPAPHAGMKSAKHLKIVKHVQKTAESARSLYAETRSATRLKHVKHAQLTVAHALPYAGMTFVHSMRAVKNVPLTAVSARKVVAMVSVPSASLARAVHLIAVCVSAIAAISRKTRDVAQHWSLNVSVPKIPTAVTTYGTVSASLKSRHWAVRPVTWSNAAMAFANPMSRTVNRVLTTVGRVPSAVMEHAIRMKTAIHVSRIAGNVRACAAKRILDPGA